MRMLAVVFVTILVLHAKTGVAEDIGFSDIKDLLQIGGDVKVTEISKVRTAKSLHNSFEDTLESFLKSNEVSFNSPFGSTVTFSGRELDNDEIYFKLRLNSGSEVEARKKSKVKKLLAPILVIILLKAITLIPLAIGLLGLKTWNALQLAFVSFVTSVVLAVWKLCAKFSDHHIPAPQIIHEAVHDVHIPHVYHDSHHDHHVVHHGLHHDLHHDDHHHHHDDHYLHDDHHALWDHHYHRSDDSPQQLAYNGYAPETKL